jgi:hypothetical protein
MLSPLRLVLTGWLSCAALALYAQATQAPRPLRLDACLEYDSFFGVAPALSVSKSLDSLRELSLYGVFYPNPAFFGVETGLTFSYTSPAKAWTLMPGLGVVSGSVSVEGRPFRVGEGYLGSLAA